MPIWWRRRGNHQRVIGLHPHQAVHLGEVRGHEVDRSVAEVWARDVREEVRAVLEGAAVDTAQVRPIVEHMHLMDAHFAEARGASAELFSCGGLDCVEHCGGLSVAKRNDQLCARIDVFQDITGGTWCSSD